MSWFSKFLTSGAGSLVESIGNTIDKFNLSQEEKEQFKLETQRLIIADRQMTEDTIRTELEAKAGIIKAELAQGDNYTKRSRPTIVYAGLAFIAINHVVFPCAAYLFGVAPPVLDLPVEFWATWGGVCGVYSLGRTVEKRGVSNAFTRAATGNKPPSLLD